MISNKKNEIKVTHFPKKHRFSPILFCKDNDKITRKEEIKAIPGEPPYENPPREIPLMGYIPAACSQRDKNNKAPVSFYRYGGFSKK
ncbi:hypothetical protein, partial [Bacteroides clarus]|uniref:hypothetical protein n=1 Tax=Bacteroides clarus TaxID=626929 RepID=UPI003FEDE4B3